MSGKILLGLGWDPPENEDGAVLDTGDESHMDLDVGLVLFGQVRVIHRQKQSYLHQFVP